jgi:hypothetical protein
LYFSRRPIDFVIVIDALHRAVGRDFDHVELVDVAEFGGFGRSRTGHAAELVVEAEIILERDRGQRLVLRLDVHAFLGFDGLVQTFRQTPASHHAAGEFIDENNFAVLDDVVFVARNSLCARSAWLAWWTMEMFAGS